MRGIFKCDTVYQQPDPKFSCKYCERVFRNRGHLNEHVSGVHERSLVVPCPICQKDFATRKRMRKHLINSHKITPPRNSDLYDLSSLISNSGTEVIQFEIIQEAG